MGYLEGVRNPSDLARLSLRELYALAAEIRARILDVVSVNAGHLASNLGTVELTIALHRTFESPRDAIVWDVGHQTYAHKLLTGRLEAFSTLRTYRGLCGFPRRSESPHDAFDVGHSSTSLSAALGILRARANLSQPGHVVAVVGDGALTGGMCYEALNDAGLSGVPLIGVLNDNEMSISQNVGALTSYLTNLRASPGYLRMKRSVSGALLRTPLIGRGIRNALDSLKNVVRYILVPGEFFEALGWKYLGPIDGHDIAEMERIFERAKRMDRPVMIHVVTRKGKGYAPAERRPDLYHGVGAFDVRSGIITGSARSCADVVRETLLSLMKGDPRVAAVTAAMAQGTGLEAVRAAYPQRTYDVGIAEEHAVTMAAGLAVGGMRPFFAVYSTFLQRAYDQVLHDICLQNLPVTLLIDRAGLGGEDGATHHGVYDLSFMRGMPGLTILAPRDERSLADMMRLAVAREADAAAEDAGPRGAGEGEGGMGGDAEARGPASHRMGPLAIRYPKALPAAVGDAMPDVTRWQVLLRGDEAAPVVLAVGRMVSIAWAALEHIEQMEGMRLTLVDAARVQPLDGACLFPFAGRDIFTVEDGILAGGFGSAVVEQLMEWGTPGRVRRFGLPAEPLLHGSAAELLREAGMDADSLAVRISWQMKAWREGPPSSAPAGKDGAGNGLKGWECG